MGRIPKLELEEIVSSDVFRRMRQLQLVDETELRNLTIREEYENLRNKYYSQPKAFEVLREKFCLSDATIRKILYTFTAKKNNTPLVFK
ncbi:MAG TPA: hypothetical protein VLB50_11970 [Ignavibacteriaceae bacterium]|nr:hypothetical protein [Ignavibacteriaceae bacterium]